MIFKRFRKPTPTGAVRHWFQKYSLWFVPPHMEAAAAGRVSEEGIRRISSLSEIPVIAAGRMEFVLQP